jgi:hypothetical protein
MNITAEDQVLVEAFLARVGVLTPADWGKLDALGARLTDGTPFAFLDRAHADGAAFGSWRMMRPGVATGTALAVRAAFWTAVGAIGVTMKVSDPTGEKMRARFAARQPTMEEHFARHPEAAQSHGYFKKLMAICRAQPGNVRTPGERTGTERALHYALIALSHRQDLPRDAFEAAYAFVEPVIPFLTLTGDQKLLPASTAG